MKPVQSSNVSHIGYDPATKTLSIQFKGGNLYHYEGVSPEAFKALEDADSIGGHIARHIRGKYQHKKATQEKKK
jgi:hypothetical protein